MGHHSNGSVDSAVAPHPPPLQQPRRATSFHAFHPLLLAQGASPRPWTRCTRPHGAPQPRIAAVASALLPPCRAPLSRPSTARSPPNRQGRRAERLAAKTRRCCHTHLSPSTPSLLPPPATLGGPPPAPPLRPIRPLALRSPSPSPPPCTFATSADATGSSPPQRRAAGHGDGEEAGRCVVDGLHSRLTGTTPCGLPPSFLGVPCGCAANPLGPSPWLHTLSFRCLCGVCAGGYCCWLMPVAAGWW